MTIISKPVVTVNKLPASLTQGVDDQKILVIGQGLSTGTYVSGALNTAVQQSEVRSLCGAGSQLTNALNALFDVFEDSGSLTLPQVDVIALDDAGGATDAEATITVSEIGGSTNAATVAGTIQVSVGSQNDYTMDIDVAVGDGITSDIADAIVTAITALTDIPVTAANVGGVVTLTARNGGTVGNGVGIRVRGLGLSGSDYVLGNVKIAITAFSSGATDPTLTNVLDVVGDEHYQTITYPVEYGIDFGVDDFLDDRFNVDDEILDGVCVLTKSDSRSNHVSALTSENSQSLVYICNKLLAEATHVGPAMLEFDYVISARVAALRALRRTEDSNITRITPAATRGFLDASGGMHISSLPYFNTPMYGVDVFPTGKGFTRADVALINAQGGSVVGNNKAGNTVILGEMRTAYKTDAAGNVDLTWRYLNTVDTMSACAEYIFNNLKADFVQSRLTEGNLVAGYAMVNEEAFIAQVKKYYIDLSDVALVPEGETAISYFLTNMAVIIDMVNGKITANANLPIVVQLRSILANLKTTFTISS